MNKYLFYIFFSLCFTSINAQNNGFKNGILDSIQQFRKLSKNESLNLDTRLKHAQRASELSYKTRVDSTILLSNKWIAYIHNSKSNYEHAIQLSHKNLILANKLKDSLELGHINYFIGECFYYLEIHNDSAYHHFYKAQKIFEKLKKKSLCARLLSNMASIQQKEHNYIGSEANLIKAIKLVNSLPENVKNLDRLFVFYNQLGLNSKHQRQHNKAIDYHKKALDINNKLSDKALFESNYLYGQINISEVYKEMEEYKKALIIYRDLLKKKHLYSNDLLSYVAILNNKAYNLFLSKNKNTKRIDSLFKKAYKISDSINALYEIAAIGNDMAEFYHVINKKDSAFILSKRSYTIGKDIKNYYEVSRALLMLSKIKKGETGKQYLYEHIKLNDSLLDIERASRNKYARIQFETDTYIDETKRLASQNILIVVIGLILILIFALLFIIKGQSTKNKVLHFESEQQKANEEIYALMLKQHAKIEEGRLQERHRISEELHDGILNKLLGSRLGLEYLSLNQNIDKDKYKFYIDEVQNIEKEIREISHELKNGDLISKKDFISILENYISNQSELHLFKYKINSDESINWENIIDDIKVNLYRIIQEAIQNTIKHARANSILINFYLKSNTLNLVINDNGVGFNPKQHKKGIGLKNIASRSNKLKGKFKIDSNNEGSVLKITIPVSF